jgi:hypothetical protein
MVSGVLPANSRRPFLPVSTSYRAGGSLKEHLLGDEGESSLQIEHRTEAPRRSPRVPPPPQNLDPITTGRRRATGSPVRALNRE